MAFLAAISARSQDLLPFANNNYAGVSAVYLQPASIADSRFKFDMTLVSTNGLAENNAIGINHNIFKASTIREIITKQTFDEDNLIKYKDNSDKSLIVSFRANALNMMFTLSEKSAFAITPSVRAFVNIDNVSQDLLNILEAGKITPDIIHQQLTNANLSLQANAWFETGFTYARVVYDNQSHFVKAGATLKVMQGLGSSYLYGRNINYRFDSEDTIALFNSTASFALSDNFNDTLKYTMSKLSPNLGLDFGVVYEFRPKWMEYQHAVNDMHSIWYRDQEKYLVKVGVAVTDIGSIKYRKNSNSASFVANNPTFNTDEADVNDLAGLHTLIANHMEIQPSDDWFRMNLPTAVNIQADVRIAKGLYVNVTQFIALNNGYSDENKSHYFRSLTFTPRYDGRMLGISIPVQSNAMQHISAGLGLRLGPIWLGSDNFFSLVLGKKDVTRLSAMAAFKIPLFFERPKDRDKDNIDDKHDKCPDIPGILSTGGCPDSDDDGISDQDDKCPNAPGLKEFDGCPDSDGDGIIDQNDYCPDEAGLPQFNGCPDSDGDSIVDQYDACPHAAGPASLRGCPDQDNDGIADVDDDCPSIAGTKANKGCPNVDSDGDGTYDDKDNCPTLFGPPENFGCPYNDSDSDGIPDKDDKCPDASGPAALSGCPDADRDGIADKSDQCPHLAGSVANHGCPDIKPEETEILRLANESLLFEKGKSKIKTASFAALSRLADILLQRPEIMLSIKGNPDNTSHPETALLTAKNRVQSVQDFFLAKGVSGKQMKTEWPDQIMPASANLVMKYIELEFTFE